MWKFITVACWPKPNNYVHIKSLRRKKKWTNFLKWLGSANTLVRFLLFLHIRGKNYTLYYNIYIRLCLHKPIRGYLRIFNPMNLRKNSQGKRLWGTHKFCYSSLNQNKIIVDETRWVWWPTSMYLIGKCNENSPSMLQHGIIEEELEGQLCEYCMICSGCISDQ